MEIMMPASHAADQGGLNTTSYDYDQDTAHTVEVQREMDDNGQLGSFGFTLLYERPPIVGTIVPGGAADRAGLKQKEVVIAVNGQDTTTISHQEVVSIIFNTKTPGVWLTVCERPEESGHQNPNPVTSIPSGSSHLGGSHLGGSHLGGSHLGGSHLGGSHLGGSRLGFNRVHSLGSFSSTPVIPRNMADSPSRYSPEDSLPKYHELHKYNNRQTNHINAPRHINSVPHTTPTTSSNRPAHSKGHLVHSLQQNGHSASSSSINHHQRAGALHSQARHLATFGSSEYSGLNSSRSSPTPSAASFTSASVLVLYIGPVEIPDAWSSRELSSKCLQECTRRLLSKRQEFVEAFLEVTLTSMKILAVSQAVIFKHKREELYYAGVCSNDEQYFAIVTRKPDHKNLKKTLSGSNIGKTMRAQMCHVFKVIHQKSVLILHSGDSKDSKSGKGRQSVVTKPKQKTIPVTSCVTIVNAIQGLFTGVAIPGNKIFEDISLSSGAVKMLGQQGGGGSGEPMYGNGNVSDKSKKKKLDVVDLRPAAYHLSQSSSILSTSPQNSYAPFQHSDNTSPLVANHVRSHSNPVMEYPASIGTPVYHQRPGGAMTTGGGGGTGSGGGGTSWYASNSPKDEYHSRSRSSDNRSPQGGKSSGDRPGGSYRDTSSGSSGGRKALIAKKNSNNLQYDGMRRFSDDSSISSLSDSRASSPAKMSHHSSYTSYSRSPSPNRSLSYSSRSRSPSPSPVHISRLPPTSASYRSNGGPPRRAHPRKKGVGNIRGLVLELGSVRNGVSSQRSFHGSRSNLRRQNSEHSMVDLQEFHSGMSSQHYGGLPPKNGLLSSSIGSIATVTTIVDKAKDDPEECGRVGGWVALFDKVLEDTLGVHTLLQFLKKEHCEENILFWKDIKEFKENASQAKNLPAVVKKIYDEYLSPTSPNTVNVDDRVKKLIEAHIEKPPLDIYDEAFEQIYQLMKMDCYPRFKKSPLVKECLLAEMEGKPLPIDLPQDHQAHQQQSQFTGIWKKQREFSFGKSFFGRRLGRGRVQQEQVPQVPDAGIWGVGASPEGETSASSTPESKKSKKENRGQKDSSVSPLLRKSHTVKESKSHIKDNKSKRRSGGRSDSKSPSRPKSMDDFPPEDHLNIIKAHMSNVFEVNLPNKVTKIMEAPKEGTVRDTIRPVLKKHGYNLDIMELRFANNFELIDLDSPGSVLIGQHISVIKSKNTFIAAFPDVLERILPADGTERVGDLFAGVLREMGKLQNFSVAVEGARVPLEFGTNTSCLIGQRVVVKYIPGKLNWVSPDMDADDLQSGSTERTDMDDLLSMIERLSNDKLDDQRISPGPLTPESADMRSSPEDTKLSPGERRRRTQSQGKKRIGGTNHHRPLASSKSTDMIDLAQLEQKNSSRRFLTGGRDKQRKRPKENYLKPPGTESSSNSHFNRTQSGSSLQNGNTEYNISVSPRSLSPPAGIGSGGDSSSGRNRNLSPPPPTSKPPPLPSHAKRMSGSRGGGGVSQAPSSSRWSGVSFKSTDSASSEDSLTAELPHHPKQHSGSGGYGLEQSHSRDHRSISITRTHVSNDSAYMSSSSQSLDKNQKQRQLSTGNPPLARGLGSPPSDYPIHQHPLDNVVKNSYNSSVSGSGASTNPGGLLAVDSQQQQVVRKTSLQGRPVDYSNPSHPLQMSVSKGNSSSSQAIGATYSSYPWHSAHSLPTQQQNKMQQQHKRSSMPRMKVALDNPQLVRAGDQLVKKEMEEYRRRSSSDTDEHRKSPLSPTGLHILTLSEETDRETFV